ncbi:MAG: phage portal protein [Terriglobales bacterium]
MGFLKELRSSLENPATPLSFPAEWLLDIFQGGRTDSGIRVSELTALQVTTVYACVDIISSNIARLPLNVYEITGDDASRLAREQDLHWLLHSEPNEEMTSFVFRKAMQCHALLWSNAYAEVERDAMGRPVALWPLSPAQTKPRRATEGFSWTAYNGEFITVKAGELFYSTTEGGTSHFPERPIHRLDMIHILGLSLDGRIGKEVVELSRQAIGLSLAAEKFGGKFFANGLRPSGVVTLPQNMKEQAVENFKRSLQESCGGENLQRPMVLEEGMTWTQQTTAPNDAQFLETRKFQREEHCAIFHVPPHMVGESGGTNRSTAEQLGMEFLTYTLSPWLEPWKQEMHRKLFPQRGRTANKFYPDFDVEDLMYPDADSRGKYYATLKQWGIANTDDIRRKLKWNPVGGKAGQTLWMPVNMMDADDPMTSSPM